MGNRWTSLTIDCADPQSLASFWSTLLGIPQTAEHGDDPNWATVGSRSSQIPRLTFQKVPEPKTTKVRIHIDVTVDSIESGRKEVEDLGGSWAGARYEYDEGIVLLMHDPEGHEFCIVEYFD